MPKKSGSMNKAKGLYSTKSNPLKGAKMTQPTSGPVLGTPANSDQAKVRKLRAKAYAERDALRGKSGI